MLDPTIPLSLAIAAGELVFTGFFLGAGFIGAKVFFSHNNPMRIYGLSSTNVLGKHKYRM